MTTFVTVSADNGYHVSLPEPYAKSRGLKILKEQPLDRHGRPLPERPASAAAKKAAEKLAQPAESNPSGSDNAASNQEEKP